MASRGSSVISAAVVLVGVISGCGSTKTVTETVTVLSTTNPVLEPPRERVEFGHISSLARTGNHYRLRFDPAWFLSGETANHAAAEDGVVEPGQPVPNDNYIVDEGHRLLTYNVPATARVTVLTKRGDPAKMGATAVTVAELARIIHDTSGVQLSQQLDTGVWITVDSDTVRAIHQQYRP